MDIIIKVFVSMLLTLDLLFAQSLLSCSTIVCDYNLVNLAKNVDWSQLVLVGHLQCLQDQQRLGREAARVRDSCRGCKGLSRAEVRALLRGKCRRWLCCGATCRRWQLCEVVPRPSLPNWTQPNQPPVSQFRSITSTVRSITFPLGHSLPFEPVLT